MAADPSTNHGASWSSVGRLLTRPVEAIGGSVIGVVDHIGSVIMLGLEALHWLIRAFFVRKVRVGKVAIVSQIIRVGCRAIFIVMLVSSSVGLILSLQMAPPLENLDQKEMIPNIVGIAVVRELGPLIAAIVMTGFAGAAIAAEIGTMVVGEEVEALEAHALNPVRFLVIPRVLAAVLSMTGLSVFAVVVSIGASLLMSMLVLGIPYPLFMNNLLTQLKLVDFLTGVFKGAVFGLLIGLIACANGLKVTGGAAGVGFATTKTVVQCVLSIIIADLVFTAIFYAVGLV
jgi:phospholipid/cholesterol/gamma-HCH transport system permease protein